MRDLESIHAIDLPDYPALYQFSIDRPADFWRAVWTFCGIRGEIGDRVVIDLEKMPGARFFPDARLNFAANLLRRRRRHAGADFQRRRAAAPIGEPRASSIHRSRALPPRWDAGVAPGDRVAGYMPNLPETDRRRARRRRDRRGVDLLLA